MCVWCVWCAHGPGHEIVGPPGHRPAEVAPTGERQSGPMATLWKCPNGDCEPTENKPLEVTSSGDPVRMVLCAGSCWGVFPKDDVKQVQSPEAAPLEVDLRHQGVREGRPRSSPT